MVRGARECEWIASCGARPDRAARDLRGPAARPAGERRVHRARAVRAPAACGHHPRAGERLDRARRGSAVGVHRRVPDRLSAATDRRERELPDGRALDQRGSRRAAHPAQQHAALLRGQERHRGHDHAGGERDPVRGRPGTYSFSVSLGGHPSGNRLRGRGLGDHPPASFTGRRPTWRRSWSASHSRSARSSLPGNPFVGIRAADPAGRIRRQHLCALDATVPA